MSMSAFSASELADWFLEFARENNQEHRERLALMVSDRLRDAMTRLEQVERQLQQRHAAALADIRENGT